uniref:DUF4939 domain-containing protein n=1 Tax=Sinocyclocheilus anshuiensis TaxID=1608454 RepID=A0A671NDG5_9TELE
MDPQLPTPADVLEELVNALRTTLTPAPTPQTASVSPMAMPPSYVGDAAECGSFLLQVPLYIEMQPQKFTTERTKVAFLISLLSGRALPWAKAIWNWTRPPPGLGPCCRNCMASLHASSLAHTTPRN